MTSSDGLWSRITADATASARAHIAGSRRSLAEIEAMIVRSNRAVVETRRLLAALPVPYGAERLRSWRMRGEDR